MYVPYYRSSRVERVNGCRRLGSKTSPFTVRAEDNKRAAAAEIHNARPRAEQAEDESGNEPVELGLESWESKIETRDFPEVDTVPHEELLNRAETAQRAAEESLFVERVARDASFDEQGKLGQFLPATRTVELDTLEDSFPACRTAPVLAHELGHAFHVGISRRNQKAGFVSGTDSVFETTDEREDAVAISERMRGTVPDDTEAESYRRQEEELFADVFASFVLEPEAARRVGPAAVERVSSYVSGRFRRGD
jgi:hypothetical protein